MMLKRAIISLLLLISPVAASQQNSKQDIGGWKAVVTADKMFSVLMPVELMVHTAGNFHYGSQGERIESRRVARAYFDGVAFNLEVHELSAPKKLLKYFLGQASPETSISDFVVNGFSGKQLVTGDQNFHQRVQHIIIGGRLYTLRAAARDKNHPALLRFFSSLKLGNATQSAEIGAATGAADVPRAPYAPAISTDDDVALLPGGASRKAVIIWKPEPIYTEEARRKGRSGMVRLKLLLSASGQVTDMSVEKDLGDGLTQQAMEAARYISFIPAEKDGRPASQWVTIEYNFNIY